MASKMNEGFVVVIVPALGMLWKKTFMRCLNPKDCKTDVKGSLDWATAVTADDGSSVQ